MKQPVVSVDLVKQLVFVLLLGLQSLAAAADAKACPDTAKRYWEEFRASVLRGDVTAIANASHFPFEIRGLDDSEQRHVDRKEFVRLFPALLKQDPGLSPTLTTMKSMVKVSTRLSPSFCDSYGKEFRVGDWVFHLTPDGWRFVQAFVDELMN